MVKIIFTRNYRQELKLITRDFKTYCIKQNLDFTNLHTKFLEDVKNKFIELQSYPLSGEELLASLRRVIISKGIFQCAVLYRPSPTSSGLTSDDIQNIYIVSIMRTNSREYNDYVMHLNKSADCDF